MYGIKNLFLCKLKKRNPNSVAHQMTGVKGQQQGQAVAPTQAQQSLLEPQLLCISPPCRPQGAHLLPPAGAVSQGYKVASALQIFSSAFQLGVRKKGKGKGYLIAKPSLLIQARAPSLGLRLTSHGAELSQEALLSSQGAGRMHSFNTSVRK